MAGFNVPLYTLQGQVTQPIVIALQDNGSSIRSRANPATLSSLKGTLKHVTKNLNIYSIMKIAEALGRYRAKPSKIKTQSSRSRTARMHLY